MSTLDDLRGALDQHADSLDDTERYVRPVAVRARIRAVRRRRTALAATAAVLVLIGAVGAVGVLRGPGEIQPADRVVAGVDVPDSIDVLDFPYDLTDLTDLTDGKAHVDKADHDQAVLLTASGLGGGSATLYSDGEAVARVRGGEHEQVAAPYPLADADADLRVRFDGTGDGARAGVAVYEATGELAPGVSNGDVVFRDEYAGLPLLGAAFAKPDESSVEFQARGADAMRFVPYCDGPDDLFINVEIDGKPGLTFGCGSRGPDVTDGTSGTLDHLAADRDHTVRVYLSNDSDGPEIDPDGVAFGAGVYEVQYAPEKAEGQQIASPVEYAGRDWVLDSVYTPRLDINTPDDLLVGLVGSGPALHATWTGRLSDGESTLLSTPDSGAGTPDRAASTLGGVMLAGDRYDVIIKGGQGKLLIYLPE